jgi:hypothetical protein
MKKFCLALFLAAAAGCAGLSTMAPAYVGQFLTVSLDPGVAFPAEPTLEGFDGSAAGSLGGVLGNAYQALTGGSLKAKAGALIGGASAPYTRALTEAVKAEILRRNLYKGVVDSGGNVTMRLSVSRYGLKAVDGLKDLKPLLDVKMEILVPLLGPVWSRVYTVDETSAQTLGLSAVQLLEGAASYQKAYNSASTEAAQGLLAQLK